MTAIERKTTLSIGILAALVASAVAVSAHATPFRDVWGMSGQALQAEPDASLCDAIAGARRRNLDFPELSAEAERRRLNCGAQINSLLGACEPLRLTGREIAPGRGVIYTVRNNGPRPISFRINYRAIASTPFEIGPRSEQRFGVSTPLGLGAASAYLSRKDPDLDTVMFFDCRTR